MPYGYYVSRGIVSVVRYATRLLLVAVSYHNIEEHTQKIDLLNVLFVNLHLCVETIY